MSRLAARRSPDARSRCRSPTSRRGRRRGCGTAQRQTAEKAEAHTRPMFLLPSGTLETVFCGRRAYNSRPKRFFSLKAVEASGQETASSSSAAGERAQAMQPLLVRAIRHEQVERPPIWLMRQAGRHMNAYRELCKRHPSFRERSEVAALSTEISLQPYRAYHPDAVIMFSDILTPLPGMGITFDIPERGPVVSPPVRSYDDLQRFREMDPYKSTPFVRETLQTLRRVVEPEVAVLGFVGAPWTLLTYCIEGGSSQTYSQIKKVAFTEPALLHELLARVTDNLAIYANFQIECGADAIQIFDSWAGQLAPSDFDEFAGPYLNRLVREVKASHPETPLILYINQGSHLLERMRETGVDVVSVDWTIDIGEARSRLGPRVAVQGNMDPACLLGSRELIQRRAYEIITKAGKTGHIMNLGHGVLPETPEENVLEFFRLVRGYRYDEH